MIDKLSRFVRTKRGDMSLREFAKLCGNISHTQIDSIERGIDPRTSKPVRPTVETLSKIAKGTGVSVAYLAALANGDDPDAASCSSLNMGDPSMERELSHPFTDYEVMLIKKVRALKDDDKLKLDGFIDGLLASGEYKYKAKKSG